MKYIFLLCCFLYLSQPFLNISTDIWLCAFAGWFSFIILHIEYSYKKCKFTKTAFSPKIFWDENWVMFFVSLLIILPSVYVTGEAEVLSPFSAFAVGYLNIHAVKSLMKRSALQIDDSEDDA
jgi:hypothetical protein